MDGLLLLLLEIGNILCISNVYHDISLCLSFILVYTLTHYLSVCIVHTSEDVLIIN